MTTANEDVVEMVDLLPQTSRPITIKSTKKNEGQRRGQSRCFLRQFCSFRFVCGVTLAMLLCYTLYYHFDKEGSLQSSSKDLQNEFQSSYNQSLLEYEIMNTTNSQWKCCIPRNREKQQVAHPNASEIQQKNYLCPDKPSNFLWYYDSKRDGEANVGLEDLNATKWKPEKIFFVGGSTSRQMKEQLEWELPTALPKMNSIIDRFLFLNHETRCCDYNFNMTLDMRTLSPGIEEALEGDYDFMVINVGTWWDSGAVGVVIDENGLSWKLNKTKKVDWTLDTIDNSHLAAENPPDVSFRAMMKRALEMIQKKNKKNIQVVWRSETKTACPVGTTFRSSVDPVLKELNIPVLNISQATCQYHSLDIDGSKGKGPHLCFPSVALRYWLQLFQRQFLD